MGGNSPSQPSIFPGILRLKAVTAACRIQRLVSPSGKWLSAMFDYLDKHNAADKLLYIQLGNEPDGDYARSGKDIPENKIALMKAPPEDKNQKDPESPELSLVCLCQAD